MPLNCPHCQTEQADDARSCLRCGLPMRAAAFRFADPTRMAEAAPAAPAPDLSPAPDPPRTARTPLFFLRQKPALPILAVALLVTAGILLIVLPKREPPAPRASVPALSLAPTPPSSLSPSAPPASPLKVDCFRSREGAAAPAGVPMMFTAVAYAPPGRAVTLALSARKERGPSVRFSLAQGRLCSAAWTPAAPGRYQLTATAWDAGSHVSASRSLWVRVVPTPLSPLLPEPVAPLPPARETARESGPVDLRLPPAIPYAPPLPTFASESRPVRDQAALPAASRPLPDTSVSRAPLSPVPSALPPIAPAPPALYHVVAASFPYSRSAFVLAKSFRGRGLPAAVRRGPDRQGRKAYWVETGHFRRPEEARAAAEALRHSGYPAFSDPAP